MLRLSNRRGGRRRGVVLPISVRSLSLTLSLCLPLPLSLLDRHRGVKHMVLVPLYCVVMSGTLVPSLPTLRLTEREKRTLLYRDRVQKQTLIINCFLKKNSLSDRHRGLKHIVARTTNQRLHRQRHAISSGQYVPPNYRQCSTEASLLYNQVNDTWAVKVWSVMAQTAAHFDSLSLAEAHGLLH